jgi:hypothetical protein
MAKTTQADAVKFYARRDSATAVLRKMGIPARDYNAFIEVMSDGRFACHIARAEMHLESLKNPKPAETKAAKATRPAAAAAAAETKRASISQLARALILAGKTNQEVWAELKQQFNLDDSKKHYPTWYRCEMKRRGLLPKEA